MTTESDSFESHLHAMAKHDRATQAKTETQAGKTDKKKAELRRWIELREDERREKNEALL